MRIAEVAGRTGGATMPRGSKHQPHDLLPIWGQVCRTIFLLMFVHVTV